MSAFHHLNGQLFILAKTLRDSEIHGDVTVDDVNGSQRMGKTTEDRFWNRKADEAHRAGIHKSIRQHGIMNPVQVGASRGEVFIKNGYHRAAAAYDIDPLMFVPVTYGEATEHMADKLPQHDHREDEVYAHETDDMFFTNSRSEDYD